MIWEFTARFPGTAKSHWYLSDGGHFENLGAYELLRRRLKRIIIIDAEADADYTYSGLLLLIRKARIDFGASIEFLDKTQIQALVACEYWHLFGTLEDLRRSSDHVGYSKAHVSLALVKYADGSEGKLIYVKPTLTGDESRDILNYHGTHPDFPHESTLDQFFDEAQWESYRNLGLSIAIDLFEPNRGTSEGWSPADLLCEPKVSGMKSNG